MAKMFGEFLVEKKMVTAEQVLEAVITQLRSVPSTAEVIFDHRLLPVGDQLRILSSQQLTGTDFRTSAAVTGFWNEELAAKVSRIVSANRKPLGEVLVDLGFLTTESLTQALDSYVESSAAISASKPASPQNQPESTAVSSNVPEVRVLYKQIDKTMAKEYVENFEKRTGPALRQIAAQLDPAKIGQQVLADLIKAAFVEFTSLRAAASFIDAKRSEGLARELIQTTEVLLSAGTDFDVRLLREMINCAHHLFDGICALIVEFGTEEPIESDSNMFDLAKRLDELQALFRGEKALKGMVA